MAALDENSSPKDFPGMLSQLKESLDLPGYIDDMARMEWTRHSIQKANSHHPQPHTMEVNPCLSLVPVAWSHLVTLLVPAAGAHPPPCPLSRPYNGLASSENRRDPGGQGRKRGPAGLEDRPGRDPPY